MAVGIKEVAAAASVSVGTVSNVLNAPERVAPATVARVHAAIERLGFIRNDAARQLRAGSSRCVGLLVLDVGNPFFTDVARSAERRAAAANLVVLLGTSDDDADRERAYLETFDEQRVFGLLISPVGEDLTRLHALHSRGVPVVLVDRDGTGTPFASVAVDDVAGGRLAVAHLGEQGRTRIAYVGGPHGLRQVADRLAGARSAIEDHPGVILEVIETDEPSVLAGRAAGEKLCARRPKDRPDAVFCANDLLAIGMLQALVQGGVEVPTEIALIGYDDIDFARSAAIPLSSVRQPSADIGTTAIELLLAAVDRAEPRHVVFRPELIARTSTGAATAGVAASHG
ncbi:LacI family DNA-binding transcriptional regulator [Mycolicibacterium komossense]|uniref:LacI family DNA-binding transcriptional regulator n=1 Tax=Mycolicibacterium komossense TaxID=1779 RepID=A0ABT3CAM1_9MYCO|nr:LacI family DNA-binding transcriptional regulator [Mycolicibacterium komossense]MCV7226291.1 LacI family DNA-binding transcriptional regulator [Mycolicibacterium komossense]